MNIKGAIRICSSQKRDLSNRIKECNQEGHQEQKGRNCYHCHRTLSVVAEESPDLFEDLKSISKYVLQIRRDPFNLQRRRDYFKGIIKMPYREKTN